VVKGFVRTENLKVYAGQRVRWFQTKKSTLVL
jgi:hypothetical protein